MISSSNKHQLLGFIRKITELSSCDCWEREHITSISSLLIQFERTQRSTFYVEAPVVTTSNETFKLFISGWKPIAVNPDVCWMCAYL